MSTPETSTGTTAAEPPASPPGGPRVRTNLAKGRYYLQHAGPLKKELAAEIPRDELVLLHRKSAVRHFLVLARQLALLGLGTWVSWTQDAWYLWLPAALVVGFVVFDFTVLLHEVVHKAVFEKSRPRLERLLGILYAFPSGISASQFTRWHLDHHDNLGSPTDDPKRFHLSPKRNARWYKALYMTPALIPIYFRAARRETATYDESLRGTIRVERTLTILGHAAALGLLIAFADGFIAFKVYVVPFLLVFPFAFVLNRLGQHYNVDPADPAKWSTLVADSPFWNFAFLWSNFHLEHHYFPNVPFYRLARLHRVLRPFYARRGLAPVGYGELLWNWFWLNRAPHTKWGCRGA